MSLRCRVNGDLLCGAKSEPQPDDCYIDDGLHYRLSVLYGVVIPEPDEATTGRWRWATESEWDRVRANRPDCSP
jgi:hypothetical protein